MSLMNLHLKGSTKGYGQAFLKYLMAKGKKIQPMDLQLVRDEYNPVDPNAVQVWYESGIYMEQLGFIEAELVPPVAHCMDHGGKARVIGCNVCGSADTNYGIYLTVDLQNPTK